MKNKSFTLIELLVVIVIIGILAGVIIVSVSSSINKANFAKAQSFSNTVQNELLGDLVSEWTFNSPAVSGKTEDSWGNNDGTLVGANGLPQIQTKENCVYGTCYLFDGVDDYIDCGNNSSLDITGAITMSAWIKASDATSLQTLFGKGTSFSTGGGKGYSLGIYDTKIYFDRYDSVKRSPLESLTNVVKQNEWFLITVTWDGTITTNGLKMYINGLLKKQGTSTISEISGTNLFSFSITKAPFFYKGSIDDVRIYNAALSSSQIKQQYVAGLDSLLSKNLISQEEYNQNIKNLAFR